MTTPRFEVKSQLAKLLSVENISLQHNPSTETAYFDLKARVLVLPVWKDISDDLYDMFLVHETGHAIDTNPEDWMGAVERLAKKHYAKSVIITKQMKAAVRDYLNVVEDARIDRRQKRRYPGSVKNYVEGYKELHKRDFFGIEARARKGMELNDAAFIDRANIFFKHGATFQIKFNPTEQAFIDRMARTETWAEVEQLTDEIFEYAKNNEQQMKAQSVKLVLTDDPDEADAEIEIEMEMEGDGDGADSDKESDKEGKSGDKSDKDGKDGESGKGKAEAKSGDKDGKDGQSGGDGKDKLKAKASQSEGKGDKDSKDGKGEGKASKETPKSKTSTPKKTVKEHEKTTGGNHVTNTDTEFVPECQTEESARANAKAITLNDGSEYVYVEVPKFDYSKIVDDYKVVLPQMEKSLTSHNVTNQAQVVENLKKDLIRWRAKEKDAISFMVKEFETRKAAETYSKLSIAKTGVIDTNKLHSYLYNDDIFRRNTVIPKGKNHGFVMIMDWSGSMRENLKGTLQQLFSLVLFCKRIQVPFEVYLFRTTCGQEYMHTQGQVSGWRTGHSDIGFDTFKLRNVLSSRMPLHTLNKAMECLWISQRFNLHSDPMDSTPLNQSILCADYLVKEFQKKSKVEIVNTIILTDGASDGARLQKGSSGMGHKRPRYVLTDPMTKQSFFINTGSFYGYQATNAFLKVFRARAPGNIIGFYVYEGSLNYLSHFGINTYDGKLKDQWKNEKWVGVDCAGYDQYFIINAKGMAREQNNLVIDDKMSQNKVAKEFIRFAEKKTVNRAMLANFIERISGHRKPLKTK